jgi:LemA protein
MKPSDSQIPEEIAPEVFALASRLYAEQNQSYSMKELIEVGTEVDIPPEFIQQAVREVQEKRIQTQKRQRRLKIVGVGVGVAIALWGIVTYNYLSGAAQKIDAAEAQLENQLARRANLIPNLVSITQAYAKQEYQLADLLTKSRQNYLQADTPAEKTAAEAEVSQAIERFRDYAAKNPELQSSQAFINLQYEIAGTENRIAVERMRYNQAVQNYNQQVKQFPNVILAPIFGFKTQPFYPAKTSG